MKASAYWATVGRVISQNKLAELFSVVPEIPDDTAAGRGFYDRRGIALRYASEKAVREAMPTAPVARQMFMACLDALGDTLFLQEAEKWGTGFQQNIRAAQNRLVDHDQPPVADYDTNAYLIATEAMRNMTASPAATDYYEELLTPEVLDRAEVKSLPHTLLRERLHKHKDILAVLLNEERDIDAFLWQLSRHIQDQPSDEEIMWLMVGSDRERQTTRDSHMLKLQELFETRRERDAQLKELFTNRKGRRAPTHQYRKKIKLLQKEARELLIPVKKYAERLKQRFEAAMSAPVKIQTVENTIQAYLEVQSEADILSHAQHLIEPAKARTALSGLYSNYATELKKTDRQARLLAQRLKAAFDLRLERDKEDGDLLDPVALPQLVIKPGYDTIYSSLTESGDERMDTAVTLLLDNSGSMAGDHKIQLAFMAGERLSYWLSGLGIKTEILGFTTSGKEIETPQGRTVGVHHIIYKDRNEPHHAHIARRMAAMLDNALLRSNADGEALLWAQSRLSRAAQKRKILLVLSDGTPAYAYKGDRDYQPETQLRRAIAYVESLGSIELVGIGIGHDVSGFYSQSIALTDAAELAGAMAAALRQVILSPRQSRRRARNRGSAPAP